MMSTLKIVLRSSLFLLLINYTAYAENTPKDTLVADMELNDAVLDLVTSEAGEVHKKNILPATSLQQTTPVAPSNLSESSAGVVNSNPQSYGNLAESVTKQLSNILEVSDTHSEKETTEELEKMVTSALINGNDMNALRSVVDSAMKDLKLSNSKTISSKKIAQVSVSLKQLIRKKPTSPHAMNTKKLPETIIVEKGDSLFKIALRLYGSGDDYLRLYEANKNSITDPNLIRIGQVLQVPQKS